MQVFPHWRHPLARVFQTRAYVYAGSLNLLSCNLRWNLFMDAYLQVLKEEMDVHFRRFGEPADCVAPGSENLRQMGVGLFARLVFTI